MSRFKRSRPLRALGLVCLGCLSLAAQNSAGESQHSALGFRLSNLAGDLGVGLEATSPYLAHGSLAFRSSLNLALRQGYRLGDPAEMKSENYGVAKVGVVGVGGTVAGCIRLYGEGGLLLILPGRSFSTETTHTGGYGHFGFEFLMGTPGRQRASYFIELGTVGADAHADRQIGKPIYMNGFAIGTGFRLYL